MASDTSNLLLTGPPGIGKTTLVIGVADSLGGYRLGGLTTEEIRQRGRRVGFALVPFSGRRRIMAHRDLDSRQRVSRYGVDVAAIDAVVDEAISPLPELELFIVDEIGRMECFSARFVAAMRRLLDDPRPVVATVAARGGGLIAQAKARPDVELLEVSVRNRDQLVEVVRGWIERRLPGG